MKPSYKGYEMSTETETGTGTETAETKTDAYVYTLKEAHIFVLDTREYRTIKLDKGSKVMIDGYDDVLIQDSSSGKWYPTLEIASQFLMGKLLEDSKEDNGHGHD